jgi:hypothetical protein
VLVYFGVLIGWRGLEALSQPSPGSYFVAGAAPLALLATIAAVSLAGLAWLSSRTTTYAVTDRRVVMRIGIVVSSVVNIPFRQVESAAVKRYRDGTGDLALRLGGTDRIAYFHLWPHARAWRLSRPEPAFRCVAGAERIAEILGAAVAALGTAGPNEVIQQGEPGAAPAGEQEGRVHDLVQTA